MDATRWPPRPVRPPPSFLGPPLARYLDFLQKVAFGVDARQRLRLKRSLLATAVYVVCLIVQWELADLGLAEIADAKRITAFCVVGLCLFLVAIRSGLSRRCADAALTMPQMVFAILSIAIAYHVTPSIRASMTVIVPLVLVFGAFILPARRCVQLGWFAVAILGSTIGYGAWSAPEVFVPIVEAHTFGFIALVVPTLAYLAGQLSQLRIDQQAQKVQLRDVMERLRTMATHDTLTGLPNRRHIDDWLAGEMVRTRHGDQPLCVAILDLDRFKRINDTFGHAAGDEVLRVFAQEATAMLRKDDVVARWGGEEFLLVLPSTDLVEARAVVERLRERVARSTRWAAYPFSRVTFSAGLTSLRAGQTLEQALQCADFALYEAKNQGRDRTEIAELEPPVTPQSDGALSVFA